MQFLDSSPRLFFNFGHFSVAFKPKVHTCVLFFSRIFLNCTYKKGNISRQETIVRTIAETVGGVAVFK